MTKKFIFLYFIASFISTLSLQANEITKYQEEKTPPIFSQWVTSEDKSISVCLAAGKNTFIQEEPVIIRCVVKNKTEKTLTILKPFGDSSYTESSGLNIIGPDGKIEYKGPMKEYVLGRSSFDELPPHFVMEETWIISKKYLPDFGSSGVYTIKYTYYSGGYYSKKAPDNFWKGSVKTLPIAITIK